MSAKAKHKEPEALFPGISYEKLLQDLKKIIQAEVSLKVREEVKNEIITVIIGRIDKLHGRVDTGFSELNGKMDKLQRTVETGFSELKSEISGGFQDLKTEMRNGFTDLKTEMATSSLQTHNLLSNISGQLNSLPERLAEVLVKKSK